jgi:hypothetical protein
MVIMFSSTVSLKMYSANKVGNENLYTPIKFTVSLDLRAYE